MLKNGPLCWPQGSFTASSHPVGFLSPLLSKGYDRIAHLITQATPAQVLGAGGQATAPPAGAPAGTCEPQEYQLGQRGDCLGG